MGRNEADTRAQLIDPALHQRGWTEAHHIKREQTPGAIDIVQGRGKRRSRVPVITGRPKETLGSITITVTISCP